MQLTHDRWLVPARQCELPGRDLVHPNVLHARREWTFLVLAAGFLIATVALPLFAAGTVVDLGALFGLDQPVELALGVLVFPIALVIAQLVCELFGAHRTDALVVVGVLGSVAIAGLALAADSTTLTLGLALLTYGAVASATNAIVFGSARRALRGRQLGLRSIISIAVAQAVGWSAFLVVMYVAGRDVAVATNLAVIAALVTCASAVVLILPFSIARRALTLYLRVGRTDDAAIDHTVTAELPRRLPPALIIDEPYELLPLRPTFTTGEMEFFAEGEELANAN